MRHERQRELREGRRQEQDRELNERVQVHWERDEAPMVTLPRLLEGTRREREGYVRRRQRAEREAEAVRLRRQAVAERQRQRERERKRRRLEKAGKIVCDVQQPLRWGGVQGADLDAMEADECECTSAGVSACVSAGAPSASAIADAPSASAGAG